MMSTETIHLKKSGYGSKAAALLVVVLIFATATLSRCQAQTWAEIFKQKKTQKKYLLEQIAALQVYLDYARKGYELAGSGLQVIRDISNGEFSLHNAFISGLKQVSPAVRNDARVAGIVVLQLAILKSFSAVKGNGILSADQLAYVAEVSGGVISECYHDLEELLLLITAGKMEMKDDERLARLDRIYERMLDKSAFTQKFCGQAAVLIRQKEMETGALDRLRRYYELE